MLTGAPFFGSCCRLCPIGCGLLQFQQSIADLDIGFNQFVYGILKMVIVGNLSPGLFHRCLGDDPRDGLAIDRPGEGPARSMTTGAIPCTVAVGFPAFPEPRNQRSRTKVLDGGQLLKNKVASGLKGREFFSWIHGFLPYCQQYILSVWE